MNWLQFFASIIGSLAWPSVIIALLLILRKQIAGLAERVKELTLPGGIKATFEEATLIIDAEANAIDAGTKTIQKQIAEGEPPEEIAKTAATIATSARTANNAIQFLREVYSSADWDHWRAKRGFSTTIGSGDHS